MKNWFGAVFAAASLFASAPAGAAIMDATFKGHYTQPFVDPLGIFNGGTPGRYDTFEAVFRYDTDDILYSQEFIDEYGAQHRTETLDNSDGSPFLAGWIIMNGVRYDFTPSAWDLGINDAESAFFRMGTPGSSMDFFGGDRSVGGQADYDPFFRSLSTPGWTKYSFPRCVDNCQYVTVGPGASAYPNDFIMSVSFAAVPEPSAWALMILGFGVMGTALRQRYASAAKSAAYFAQEDW